MKSPEELVRTARSATLKPWNKSVTQANKNRPRSVASVLCNYMATALDPNPGITRMVGCGLPADTVSVHRQDIVLSFTCLSAPHFRAKVRAVAQMESRDVVLVRSCRSTDVFPVTADVTLAGGGLAPFCLHDLELYRHQDQSLWLVPPLFSAAVLLSEDGLVLQMVPPYSSVRERSTGVYRATAEIAAQIFPEVAQ